MALPGDSRSERRRRQNELFQNLLRSIVPANSFYTRKLAGLDLSRAPLESLPFTVKQELVEDQRAHPPYGTNLTFPLDHYTRWHQTSGTSGKPLLWLDTPESWSWMIDNWVEVFRAAGVSRSDRI